MTHIGRWPWTLAVDCHYVFDVRTKMCVEECVNALRQSYLTANILFPNAYHDDHKDTTPNPRS